LLVWPSGYFYFTNISIYTALCKPPHEPLRDFGQAKFSDKVRINHGEGFIVVRPALNPSAVQNHSGTTEGLGRVVLNKDETSGTTHMEAKSEDDGEMSIEMAHSLNIRPSFDSEFAC
jgi:hypothetical protein